MLCQFSVKNFRCIKDEAVLDMQAVTSLEEHKDSIIVDKDSNAFLRLAAIYGPNGGGKSTVLEALYSLAATVVKPVLAVQNSGVKYNAVLNSIHEICPFKFDEETRKEPTEFELFFRTQSYEYQYKLSVLTQTLSGKIIVLDESLARKELKDKDNEYEDVFARKNDGKGKNEVSLFGNLKEYKWNNVSSNITFLSYLAITYGNDEIISDVIDWFTDKLDFLDYKQNNQENYMFISGADEDTPEKELMLLALAEMQIDIDDYRIEKTDIPGKIKIFTQHNVNGKKYELNLNEESSGTIKIFNSIPRILEALFTGGTLLIDELDAKLHPVLLQYIINLFRDSGRNQNNAQLIFTSQDIITMTKENFRRDEIWFAAKNVDQATQLYSLIEFQDDRANEEYNVNYLDGRYGADPFLKRMENWGDISEQAKFADEATKSGNKENR